ncbi:MAG: MFS transporter [Dehalococcoidia bacterium]
MRLTREQSVAIPHSAWAVLAATGLGMFLVGLDVSIANIAFPDIRRSFPRASFADLSWVLNAYIVLYAGLLIAAGRIADRIGRRRVYLTGLTGFVAASALVASAPSAETLIGARAAQGAFAAIATPASLGLLVAAFPPERRAMAVSLWGAILAVAVATGPSVGAAVIEAASWRWAFLLNLPIGLIVLLFAYRVLRESPPDTTSTRPDILGGLLVTATVALAALAIVQGRDWGWTSAAVIGTLAAAGAALLTLVWRAPPSSANRAAAPV